MPGGSDLSETHMLLFSDAQDHYPKTGLLTVSVKFNVDSNAIGVLRTHPARFE